MNAFKRNLGLRIDHILLSDEAGARVHGQPHRQEHARHWSGPSDHAPVITELQ